MALSVAEFFSISQAWCSSPLSVPRFLGAMAF